MCPTFYDVKIKLLLLDLPGHPGPTAILDVYTTATDPVSESEQRPALP